MRYSEVAPLMGLFGTGQKCSSADVMATATPLGIALHWFCQPGVVLAALLILTYHVILTMKSNFRKNLALCSTTLKPLCWLILLLPLNAISQEQDSLYYEILAADQAAFSAYNDRDIDEFAKYLSPDVEFYHDQDGLIAPYDTLVNAFAHLFRPDRPTKTVRVLDSSSFQAYSIPGYGAVETATHTFYQASEEENRFATIAKTFMLWKQVTGGG